MREMKDSGVEWIGEIPISWQTLKLKYLASCNDTVLSESTKANKEIDYIDIGSVTYESGINAIQRYSFQDAPSRARRIIHTGDTIISTVRTYLKAVAYINAEYDGFIASTGFSVFTPNEEIVSKFLFYALSNHSFISEVESNSIGISYPAINNTVLNNLKVVLPSRNIQSAIVNYLDNKCSKIDTIIDKQYAIIEKLKEYKLSLITESVTRGLNYECQMKDSGIDYIGLVPAHWHQCRLRNIGGAQNGISKGAEYFGEGFPFVSYGDVYRNYSLPYEVQGRVRTTAEEQEHYSVEAGDIFFTRTSETIDEVGFSCVCEKSIPMATYAGFVIRVRPYSNVLYTGYAKYYFRSSHHRSYLAKEMNLVTRASLGQDLLKSMPVLVPPKEEQKAIASFLDKKCDEIDRILSQKEGLINKLIDYKKSMIYEIVTGKKEVP